MIASAVAREAVIAVRRCSQCEAQALHSLTPPSFQVSEVGWPFDRLVTAMNQGQEQNSGILLILAMEFSLLQ